MLTGEASCAEQAQLAVDLSQEMLQAARLASDVEDLCVALAGPVLAQCDGSRSRGGAGVELLAPGVLGWAWPAFVSNGPVTVVSGFANSDLSAGGCGAGSEAWADWRLLRDERLSRVLVHLGGLTEMTFVPAAAAACEVLGGHLGPGAVVLNGLARRHFGQACDTDGSLAARGKVQPALLNEMLAHPFLHRPLPKATSAMEWGQVYLDRLDLMARKRRIQAGDLMTTATEMIARFVAEAVGGLTERPHQVILAGGLAHNIHLAGRIRSLLSPCSTVTTESLEIPITAYRTVRLALLAAARLDAFAAHCPSATGASRPTVLGSVLLG
jgi:anhydro-N-acetylmuramic acid kinase